MLLLFIKPTLGGQPRLTAKPCQMQGLEHAHHIKVAKSECINQAHHRGGCGQVLWRYNLAR